MERKVVAASDLSARRANRQIRDRPWVQSKSFFPYAFFKFSVTVSFWSPVAVSLTYHIYLPNILTIYSAI